MIVTKVQVTEEDIKECFSSERCPRCKFTKIAYGSMESDYDLAWQTAECMYCGLVWDEVYRLTKVEINNFKHRDDPTVKDFNLAREECKK